MPDATGNAKCFGLWEPGTANFAALNASRYIKDVIRVGRWVLPDGRHLDVNRRRMDEWCAKHRAMTAAGIRIPFPVDHSKASLDNMGWVEQLYRDGNTLKAVIEVPRPEHAGLIGKTIREVSISVDPSYRDGTGRDWGEVVRHVAPCTTPVVHGQENFVPLAARAGGQAESLTVIMCRKEPDVEWRKKIAETLNLSEADADKLSDDELAAKLKSMADAEARHTALLREAKDQRDKAGQECLKLREEIKELKAGAPAPKIPETPELIEMRKQLERMTREGAEAKVAALRAEGKVTPAMEPAVRELLCARQMNLRVADKDSDVAAQVEMIFASLPKGAALDMSERTKRFTAEPNPNDKDHDADPKELRAAGAAAAAAVQGRKA